MASLWMMDGMDPDADEEAPGCIVRIGPEASSKFGGKQEAALRVPEGGFSTSDGELVSAENLFQRTPSAISF